MSDPKQAPATRPWVINAASSGRWPPLQLDQFWSNAELIYFFALRDVKVRYKQAFLGTAWAGLQPLVGALTFTILFNRLADVDVGRQSYFAFALVGFVVWTYFSTPCNAGTDSLLYNAELLTKVSFPRIVAAGRRAAPGLIDLARRRWCWRSSSAVASGGGLSPVGLLVGLPLGLGAAAAHA